METSSLTMIQISVLLFIFVPFITSKLLKIRRRKELRYFYEVKEKTEIIDQKYSIIETLLYKRRKDFIYLPKNVLDEIRKIEKTMFDIFFRLLRIKKGTLGIDRHSDLDEIIQLLDSVDSKLRTLLEQTHEHIIKMKELT